ncbi:unnamed protein product [Caenorhabditis angaria]|uniref:Enoyl-CoA hydratase/isomerase family protein n=1 Tax=Caenorhabditis angaria TaxID=860376 RepID=A0A9P1I6D2_9PELO|nr:unnamed protein product [Caenorhabditis angaria]
MVGVIKPSKELLNVLKKWAGGNVKFEKYENQLDVKLNRPDKHNSLSGTMMLELAEHSEKFTDPKISIIRISGAGKSFCSGADLGLIKDISENNLGIEMFEFMSKVLRRISSSKAISIANIHGYAFGGATEICSSANIRIADAKSKIKFSQSMMGIVPSWGGAEYLEEIMGRGRALSAMCRANVMTAEEAEKLGWIDFVYKNEDEANKFLQEFTSSGYKVVQAQKAMLNAVKKYEFEKQKHILDGVWKGETHKNALNKQFEAIVKKSGN